MLCKNWDNLQILKPMASNMLTQWVWELGCDLMIWDNNFIGHMYRTCAIITCGLYTFYLLFEVQLCTVTYVCMYGQYSRAVSNQERVIVARVQYIFFVMTQGQIVCTDMGRHCSLMTYVFIESETSPERMELDGFKHRYWEIVILISGQYQ